MTPLEAILYFVGIPLTLAAVIALAVAAPSWTQSSRGRATDPADKASGTDTVLITSASAAPNPSLVPREISAQAETLTTGGAHASW